MKHIILATLSLFFITISFGQSLSPVFNIKNEQLEVNVYSPDHGTRGISFSFEYEYKHNHLKVIPVNPVIKMKKNGMDIYNSAKTILPLKSNEWGYAMVFIPYRDINLLNGRHEGIDLSIELDKLYRYATKVGFEQPTRYAVEIDLKAGNVKKQLKNYDKGVNAKEWLPDVYYKLTTNDGKEPVYLSTLESNTYDIQPKLIKFHILEGERLYWYFYDRDGSKDLLLGMFDEILGTGDYKDNFYGQMFGNISGLDFTYSQKAQVRQAISIYSDAEYLYKKKKGVAVTIEYDLARAYKGDQATINLNCYTKNGIKLDIPTFYAIEGTPEVGKSITLDVKGRLKYFIPFYIWKNNCQDIEFYFDIPKKEQEIRAAMHTLSAPIEFNDLVIDSELAVTEQTTFQGAKGVRLDLNYELVPNHPDAPLEIRFLDAKTKEPTKLAIYNVTNKTKIKNIGYEDKIAHPKAIDNFSYFIPYSSITENQLHVQMDLIPDLVINVLKEKTPKFVRIANNKDANLNLVFAGNGFSSNNYGQVLRLKMGIPKFFLNQCELVVDVKKNGRRSSAYAMEGIFTHDASDFTINQDSGDLAIVFPHRNIETGNKYSLVAYIKSKENQSMSDTVYWNWTAPKELFNRTVEVALSMCKFDKEIMQDTSINDNNFPWEYVVEVGNERLIQEPLSKKLTAKDLKEKFKQKIWVNREDNITVKLMHKRKDKSVVLWKGDLGKWEQNSFKAELEERYPVKKVKVFAKKQDGTKKGDGVL